MTYRRNRGTVNFYCGGCFCRPFSLNPEGSFKDRRRKSGRHDRGDQALRTRALEVCDDRGEAENVPGLAPGSEAAAEGSRGIGVLLYG